MYYTLSDDVSMVRGSHQFAFGYSGFKYQHSQKANVFSSINFGFNGIASGLGMSDFLLGRLGTLTQGTPNTTFTYKWYHALYAQDTWKVSRRLTANLGLRWEPFLPQGINNGAVYNFSWDRFNQGVRSTVFKNAPVGLLFAGGSTTAIANPIGDVLDAFNVSMVGTGTGPDPSASLLRKILAWAKKFSGITETHAASAQLPAHVSEAAVDAVRRVKERHEGRLLATPGVIGVGVGLSDTIMKQAAIEIYVKQATEPLRQALPKSLDGVETKIVETGEIRAY